MGCAALTGIGGNSSPELISGLPTGDTKFDALINEAAKECYDTFGFEKFGYCEAGIDGGEIRFGVEPAYMYEDLKLITINKEKNESRYITGVAWGPWGSNIASNSREYGQYRRRSKFTRFVDKWHARLFV